ncbi:hypothetical protein ACJZ2D_016330 [Fusarium nematophilum]
MFIRYWLLGVLGVVCIKTMPLLWHFRFFWALSRRLSRQKAGSQLIAHQLLLPSVMTSRSPPTECDLNMHKSNSTYFTDLDISRAHLSGLLFSPMFLGATQYGQCNLLVGAVACVFRKEIKPQQTYELWTRVASWDEKWLYMITHFVVPDSRRPQELGLTSSHQASVAAGDTKGSNESPQQQQHEGKDQVLASAVTRMVFKKGRLTVTPAQAFAACNAIAPADAQNKTDDSGTSATEYIAPGTSTKPDGGLLGSEKLHLEALEPLRKANLPIVQLHKGWDAVHALFDDAGNTVLSRHRDIIF